MALFPYSKPHYRDQKVPVQPVQVAPEPVRSSPDLIVLDTETGGLQASRHSLLSLAAARLDQNLFPVDRFSVYINPQPGLLVDPRAAEINGYTPEKWAQRGAVNIDVAMGRFMGWLPKVAVAVAHNASFDSDFYYAATRRCGIMDTRFKPEWICTKNLFKRLDKELGLRAENHKLVTLATLCGHWGPGYERGDHEATADTDACAAGYKWLIERRQSVLQKVKS